MSDVHEKKTGGSSGAKRKLKKYVAILKNLSRSYLTISPTKNSLANYIDSLFIIHYSFNPSFFSRFTAHLSPSRIKKTCKA
jgi:hypothetical protein